MGIREEERVKSILMFATIFLIIASLLIVKPVRNSLFLANVGIARLPFAFIAVAVSAALFVQIYGKWSKTVRLNRLIIVHLGFSIFIYTGFWILFRIGIRDIWLIYCFYAWVSLFGLVSASHFWMLAGYVFDAREAKRLFGFIGAGAITGGIFGGYMTKLLAPVIGTDNMILVCIGMMFICLIIIGHVWKTYAQSRYSERIAQARKIGKSEFTAKPLRLLGKSKHLAYLGGIIGISVVIASLVDFQYNAIASASITDPDELTAFFGFWLSNLSIISLTIQLFFTGRIIKHLGVISSLFFLPLGILIGAVVILINPVLWCAVILKVCDGGFKQSINRAGIELLALPIPSTMKSQGKTFVDVFIDSLATGLGGLLLILFTRQMGLSVQHISYVIMGGIGLWILFILRAKPAYIDAFRQAIQKRSIDPSDQTVNLQDASVFESLLQVLEGQNERQILYALQLLENAKNDKFIPILKKLVRHPSDDIRLQSMQLLIQFEEHDILDSARSLVKDENEDVKIAAVRYIYQNAEDSDSEISSYLNHADAGIRSAALLCAAYESRENEAFDEKIDIKQLFDEFVDSYLKSGGESEQKTSVKMTLARFIGIADDARLYPFLAKLMRDEDLDVVKIAVQSAGMTQAPTFLPDLINHLTTGNIRKTAREALARYGNDVIDVLNEYLENPDKDQDIRYTIPRVFARIGSQESVNLLLGYLDKRDVRLRHTAVQALNKLRTRFPLLQFDRKGIEKQVRKEIDRYHHGLSILTTFKTLCSMKTKDQRESGAEVGIEKARTLLVQSIEDRLESSLEAIFILLGLIYPQKDISNAYNALTSEKSHLKVNALEFIDNTLSPAIKKDILWIVDKAFQDERKYLHRSREEMQPESEEEAAQKLLDHEDYWIKSCTLHYMATSGMTEPLWMIRKLTRHHDPIVRETAEYALNRI